MRAAGPPRRFALGATGPAVRNRLRRHARPRQPQPVHGVADGRVSLGGQSIALRQDGGTEPGPPPPPPAAVGTYNVNPVEAFVHSAGGTAS